MTKNLQNAKEKIGFQHGIAPAMKAKQNGMLFGGKEPEGMGRKLRRVFGVGVGKVSFELKKISTTLKIKWLPGNSYTI